MITKEDIGKLATKQGGVYKLSYQIGLTPTQIYRLISGESKPSYDTIEKLIELETKNSNSNAEVENETIQT
jgi:DNA-binding phage protein